MGSTLTDEYKMQHKFLEFISISEYKVSIKFKQ